MTETTQIEAGRELDALVAVEVMGWRLEGSVRGARRLMAPGLGVAAIKERGQEWSYIGYPKPILTAFSTTGDGMLAVIERMRALGWEFAVYCDPGEAGWSVTIGGALLSRDTLPHAVCLAALEAVRA